MSSEPLQMKPKLLLSSVRMKMKERKGILQYLAQGSISLQYKITQPASRDFYDNRSALHSEDWFSLAL